MANEKAQRLAILIDAENTQASLMGPLLEEISRYGTANTKRVYGNWTSPYLGEWKKALLKYALHPFQQFSYTSGKNSTDSALIIDAMDLLYTNRFDGFCLVSSDSDFTRLASRLRESGMVVYGIGRRDTPKAFVSACDKFLFTDVLEIPKGDWSNITKPKTSEQLLQDEKLVTLLHSAVESVSDDDGWAYLGEVGQIIVKRAPEFDPRNYGYLKLSELARAIQLFDIQERVKEGAHPQGPKSVYIRERER